MTRLALIDGDVIVYAAAHAAQYKEDWGDGITTKVNKDEIQTRIDERVCDIEAAVDSDRTLVCLSPKRNFRNDLYPEYKANRKGQERPLGYLTSRTHFEENFETIERPGLEADDVMGIIATGGGGRKHKADEYVICSIDKDMVQVPGLHYRWHRHAEGVIEVSPMEGDMKFWAQVLMGDSTDNIPGLPGVGPKTADKMLVDVAFDNTPDEVWNHIVVPAYKKCGLSEDVALLTARLVFILRASHYNKKTKEPILWTP